VGGDAPIRDKKMSLSKKKEAFLKYELLTDLQNQLTSVLLKNRRTVAIKETDFQKPETNVSMQEGAATASTSTPTEVTKIYCNEQPNQGAADNEFGQKRKRNPIIVTPAWCYSEATTGLSFRLVERLIICCSI
jgi:accessory colonization factor AcfC